MPQEQGEAGAPRARFNRRRVGAIGVVLSIALLLLYRVLLENAAVDGTVVTAALILGFAAAWVIEGVLLLLPARTRHE